MKVKRSVTLACLRVGLAVLFGAGRLMAQEVVGAPLPGALKQPQSVQKLFGMDSAATARYKMVVDSFARLQWPLDSFVLKARLRGNLVPLDSLQKSERLTGELTTALRSLLNPSKQRVFDSVLSTRKGAKGGGG